MPRTLDETRVPPPRVQAAARRGLAIREAQPPSNRAGTPVGLARANQLAAGEPVAMRTVLRMVAYFDRHEADKQGAGWGVDSKGYQAWLMWGGDAGRAWARRLKREYSAHQEER